MNQLKVLLVITGLGMGGAEHVVVNLADALVELGHKVKIAYLTGSVIVSPKNTEIELIPIKLDSQNDFIGAYFRLRKVVKKFKPDVVHSHMFHANTLSRLIRLTVDIPKLVSSSHNTNEGGRLRMLVYRITDALVNISTNVSQEAVDTFVYKGAVKSDRMISVVNGIDTNQFYFDRESRITKRKELGISDTNIILAVGRLTSQKDYYNLLNSIALLKHYRNDFKLLIAGDGILKTELIALAEKLNIVNYVEFLGIRRDIPMLMSASDIFVLSSAWEGFGLVVAEAMATERIVVATDCGGVSEVVGSDGFLIETGNSPLLAKSLNEALKLNDAERSTIGASARRRIIDNYSLNANVEAYLELYNS